MRRDKEHGAIIIEATYCIAIIIIVMVFVLSLAFYLYQHVMVKIVANEVAEEAAHIYKMSSASNSSSISRTDVVNTKRYRYIFHNDDLKTSCRLKMHIYASDRLATSSLAVRESGVICTIETTTDDIGRRHYTVTVKQNYKFMLGELLEVFGLQGKSVITAEAQSVGIDMLSYMNTVKTTKYGIDKLQSNSSLLSLVNNVIELISSIMD